MSGWPVPTRGDLARAGVLDTETAAALLTRISEVDVTAARHLQAALGDCADPDAALSAVARLVDERPEVLSWLGAQLNARSLMMLLGASPVIVEHLLRHTSDLAVVERALAADYEWRGRATADDMCSAVRGLERSAAVSALRRSYRGLVIEIAVRDVVLGDPIDLTWKRLSDAADAALSAALQIASQEHPDAARDCTLAVVAMGKCGARELNYVSDVDVMFVAEPAPGASADAHAAAAVLAAEMMKVCVEPNVEGEMWQVDANLRPEGRMGALARTVESYEDYYRRWAQPWEYQALLKARAAAGDLHLGRRFTAMASQFVWEAADGPGFVAEARAMRQRVEANIAGESEREIKLGPGGLRDVEFSVQLLQLVHGRDDERLRVTATLDGLAALSDGGYVGRDDATALADTYRFLRTLEHRLQLRRLQRTHTFPTQERDIRWLARGAGITDDPVATLTARWREVSADARRRHVKLFYRPLLDAVAKVEPSIARMSDEAARERYAALGFDDADAAMRHVQALSGGVSRRAAIQRALMPVILSWLAELPLPDAGLLAFRRVSEGLGDSPWYLRSLRDETQTAHRLITILGTSRWLTELLLASPDAVALLGDDGDLAPRTRQELLAEMSAVAARALDDADAVAAIRALRRRELWRIGCADLLGLADVEAVGSALTAVMDATVSAGLDACRAAWEESSGGAFPSQIAIVAMGRYGGGELGYGSDADVMFAHQVREGFEEPAANQACIDLVGRLRSLLGTPSREPSIELDADLRPEGRNGPLIRTVESYAAYYKQWSKPWESQALLRARFAAGDAPVAERMLEVIDASRWPGTGIAPADVTEIQRLKARMESERLPRALEPMAHLKLGPGGLSDVEWVAQLLQLQHAHHIQALRTTGTIAALRAAADGGLLAADDLAALERSWLLCTRVRNYQVLVSGKATDVLPRDSADAAALARALGYGSAQEMRDEHARIRRRARMVMERVFYGTAA